LDAQEQWSSKTGSPVPLSEQAIATLFVLDPTMVSITIEPLSRLPARRCARALCRSGSSIRETVGRGGVSRPGIYLGFGQRSGLEARRARLDRFS
jgi:hypothetical protein